MKTRAPRKPQLPPGPAVLRLDPTRTGMLRRRFAAELRRRFARLRQAVTRLVVEDDAFGLQPRPFAVNERWRFASDPDKVRAFRDWLRSQLDQDILDEDLWQRYVEEGFRTGAGRAFDDVRGLPWVHERDLFGRDPRGEFLRTTLGRPVAVEKVQLLAGRAFEELNDVTSTMATRMTRHLADGLVRGLGPREVARGLAADVDGIGLARALTIARTESSRVHAEGQLLALEDLGVEDLGVEVEWSTSGLGLTRLGNPSPCRRCAVMKGRVFTLQAAKGLIPLHPN